MVAREQPSKLAAMEGLFETTEGATPITVFGFPDEEAQRVEICGSDSGGTVVDDLPRHDDARGRPRSIQSGGSPARVNPVYQLPSDGGNRLVSVGMTLLASFLLWRGTLFEQRWLLRGFVLAIALVYVGNQAGWVVAEVGRQPWIVRPDFQPVMAARENPDAFYRYHEMDFTSPVGGLRTQEAVSGAINGEMVLGSLIMFGVIYSLLVMVWVFVLNTKIHAGPEEGDSPEPDGQRSGFFEVAAEHADAAGPSLTEARRETDDRGRRWAT